MSLKATVALATVLEVLLCCLGCVRAGRLAALMLCCVVGLTAAADAPAAPAAFEPVLPAVSPNGSHIAWVEGSTDRVVVARPDGRAAHAIGRSFEGGGIGEITWTRSGILVDSNFAVFLVTAAGRTTRIGPAGDLGFSTGGTRVATGTAGCPHCLGPIVVLDVDSKTMARVGSAGEVNEEPALSPGGQEVAWTRGSGIWVARVSGGAPSELVAGGSCPQWSPNGRSIAYLSFPNGSLRVRGLCT